MDQLEKVSNPIRAMTNAKKWLGNVDLYRSNKPNKKYMVINQYGKYIHFGDINYEDFTYHRDKRRQRLYLSRSAEISGNWKRDKYSPNNLSREILWR
tara:strand:- start:292 stop:582 length:291 start_codon:yes stop_codon:yes gene_type:complete